MNNRRNRPKYRSIRRGVTPTPERRRQNGGVYHDAVEWDLDGRTLITRYRAVWSCPLDAYKALGVINGAEHLAGSLFHQAYYRTVLSRGARRERLNPRPSNIRPTASERTLKSAYRILAPQTKGAVIDICGHEEPVRDRRKLYALKQGLRQLAHSWNTAALEMTGHRS